MIPKHRYQSHIATLTTHILAYTVDDVLGGMEFRGENEQSERGLQGVLLAQKPHHSRVRIFHHCARDVVQPPVCEQQGQFLNHLLRVLAIGWREGEETVGGSGDLSSVAATFVVTAAETTVAGTQASTE